MVEQILRQVYISVRLLTRGFLKRPFVRHVSVLTLANGVGAVLSFVQGILVAQWLGPELYGVAALIMSVPALVYTFLDARSAEASVKFLSEFDAKGERERALAMCKVGYTVDLVIAGVAFLVVLLLSPWAARSIVKHPEMASLIVIYGFAFLPRALIGTSNAILTSLSRFSTIALINTVTNALRVALVLGLVGLGWQVAGVIWGNAVAMAVTGLVYGVWTYSLVKERWGRSWIYGSWHHLKERRREIFRFLAFNDIGALIGMIPKQLDVIILGYFRNPAEVGYYKLAKALATTVGYVADPLQSVVYPEFARLCGTRSANALWRKVRKLAFKVGLPLGLVAACGILLIPFILPALVGEAYSPAVSAAELLLFGSAIWLGFFWLRPAYLAAGMIKKWTSVMASFAIFTLAGWLIVAPLYGYVVVALWWALSVVVIYAGLGVAILLSSPSIVFFSRKKPSWDEYTADLVAKRATTATDWELLFRYTKGKVLDIGCGNGITLSKIYRNGGIHFAVGIDPGLPGLRYAKQRFPEIGYIQGSAYCLPLLDNQFDLIYMIDVVEHLDQPRLAIKEMYRVCKIGGHIFIQTPNYPVKRLYDFWHFIKGSRLTWKDDPTHVSRFNAWKLVRMVREAGFHIEQVIARNIPFQIDEKIPFLTWAGRKSSIGKLLGQKIIVVAVKR